MTSWTSLLKGTETQRWKLWWQRSRTYVKTTWRKCFCVYVTKEPACGVLITLMWHLKHRDPLFWCSNTALCVMSEQATYTVLCHALLVRKVILKLILKVTANWFPITSLLINLALMYTPLPSQCKGQITVSGSRQLLVFVVAEMHRLEFFGFVF